MVTALPHPRDVEMGRAVTLNVYMSLPDTYYRALITPVFFSCDIILKLSWLRNGSVLLKTDHE